MSSSSRPSREELADEGDNSNLTEDIGSATDGGYSPSITLSYIVPSKPRVDGEAERAGQIVKPGQGADWVDTMADKILRVLWMTWVYCSTWT